MKPTRAMLLDPAQKKIGLLLTAWILMLICVARVDGFPPELRTFNPLDWALALYASFINSLILLVAYSIAILIDWIDRTPQRIKGWLLCWLLSIAAIFLLRYLLPHHLHFY